MSDLTQDEFIVLSIAVRGESMIPIGRWKDATLALADRGLLKKYDESNYGITDAGRVAQEQRDDDNIRLIINANNKVAEVKMKAKERVEQAAQLLFEAAQISTTVTKLSYKFGVQQWGKAAIEKALELASEQSARNVELLKRKRLEDADR